MPDPIAVNSMFGRIARRYDFANRLLSGGVDVWWRRQLVVAVRRAAPGEVLDVATGSGDVAFAVGRRLGPNIRVTAVDFCQPMLDAAEAKKNAAGPLGHANITFRHGDGLALPFEDERFDAVTIAFGLRNLASRSLGLQEMRRVLRPGGRLFVLEFSQPLPWFRPAYFFYLRRIVPALAGIATGNRAAYVYLNETIERFPTAAALAEEIRQAGFASVGARPLTFGIVALHEAVR